MLFFDREKDENDNRARKVADRYGVKGEYNEFRRNGQSTWEAMVSLGLSEDEMNEFDR